MYLDDVPLGKEFFLGEKSIKNLYGLLFELRSMNDEVYSHYVGNGHNYFSDWIQNVIQFKKLADELRPIINRKEAIIILENSIKELNEPNYKKNEETKKEKIEAKKEAIEEEKNQVKPDKKPEKTKDFNEKAQEHEKKNLRDMKRDEFKNSDLKNEEINAVLKKLSQDKEMKIFIWKHFAWDFAKEFMYGLAIGILMGFILARIFIRF